jgi:hypothetical protein
MRCRNPTALLGSCTVHERVVNFYCLLCVWWHNPNICQKYHQTHQAAPYAMTLQSEIDMVSDRNRPVLLQCYLPSLKMKTCNFQDRSWLRELLKLQTTLQAPVICYLFLQRKCCSCLQGHLTLHKLTDHFNFLNKKMAG